MPETAPNKDPLDGTFPGGPHPDVVQYQAALALGHLFEGSQSEAIMRPPFIPDERATGSLGLPGDQYGTNQMNFRPADIPTDFAARVLTHSSVTQTGPQFQTHPKNIVDYWGPEGTCR